MRLTFAHQVELLDKAERQDVPLAQVLAQNGFTYNNLVYSDEAEPDEFNFGTMRSIDSLPEVAHGVPCVSFFSGAGGLDLGFRRAGFNIMACVEMNGIFCDTLRANGASLVLGPPYFHGDMNRTEEVIAELKKAGVGYKFPGVFIGGPPCQSFSIAANQRFTKDGDNFKRIGFNSKRYGNLLFRYIDVILRFMPKAFLIENVGGLLTIDGGTQSGRAIAMLQGAGYNVAEPHIIDAADYGVPQTRHRALIIGALDVCPSFPVPVTAFDKVPAGAALATLPIDSSGSLNKDADTMGREHKASSVRRYMMLEPGKRDSLGRIDRIDPNLPSKTIIAGGIAGGGRSHLHPFIPRTMTVRECARLQTFPDSYIFTGSIARRFTQVGNAVPPLLAYAAAKSLYQSV